MTDVQRPAGADGLMLVDATSGAGGLRVDPTQFDAYYFAPQKCFAGDGGIWLALCSPGRDRADRAPRRERPVGTAVAQPADRARELPPRPDLQHPALASLFLLADTIEWMLANGGLEFAASRCDRSAEIVYGWAEASAWATPFVAKPSERSHVNATIDFVDGIDANTIAAVLRANGIVDTEPYRKLGRNQLRIAMYPAIEPDDLATLTRAIDFVIAALS